MSLESMRAALSRVANGFQAFQKNGSLSALDIWLAGSARETDDNYQDQVVARINRISGVT